LFQTSSGVKWCKLYICIPFKAADEITVEIKDDTLIIRKLKEWVALDKELVEFDDVACLSEFGHFWFVTLKARRL